MVKQRKSTSKPRLRFPDFRKVAAWQEKPAGELFSNRVERGEDGLPIYSVTMEDGMVKRSSLDRKVDDISEPERNKKVRRNDIAYNMMRMWQGAFGIAVEDCVVSPAYIVLKPEDGVLSDFVGRQLKLPHSLRQLTAHSHGLTKDRLRLYYKDFAQIPLFLPSVDEQRKIANCLASLDEMIAAQARKVEALKAYKRGLLQQLFPREGENVPRLRFPEFRDAPEWEEARLNQLGKLVSGLTYSPGDVRDQGLLVLRSSNIQDAEIALDDCVYVTEDIKGANLCEPKDILICARNGSKSLIGKSAMIPEGMPLCTHGAFMTIFRAHAPHFVFQLLQSGSFQKQVAADLGATINSINGSQLLKYRFVVPKRDEQNRIAECLSSLSDQISAESRKLVTLKNHKKGLMLQLFPMPEEV